MNKDLKKFLQDVGVPGVISSLSLLASWIAIILLLHQETKYAILAAVIAFVLDATDGAVARKLKKTSELGRQLDGMIDLLNYSLFAALATYLLLLPNMLGIIVGFMILLFGVLRLIRFNIEGYVTDSSNNYYRGVVTCHLSLAVVCFILLTAHVAVPELVTAATLAILSLLQLSDFKTKKTGVLPFWFAVCVLLTIGAFIWL